MEKVACEIKKSKNIYNHLKCSKLFYRRNHDLRSADYQNPGKEISV